jgi:esterase/lipase
LNKLIPLIFILFFLTACIQNNEENNSIKILQPNPLRKEFITEDNVKLIGLMHQAKTNKAIILLHSLNSSKEVFSELAKELNSKGFTTIAIDSRGHGESITKNNEPYLWMNFTEKDYQLMQNDIKTIYDYLLTQNLTEIYLIASSINANNAINFASKNELKAIALFSPSIEFKGIKTINSIEKISIPVFLACSKQDTLFEDCNTLNELISSKKQTEFIHGQKHGLFILEDEFIKRNLIDWIQKQ